ncbi:deaminase domain-containing protein [Erwinia papayae]|uniref:Deaminase domain-containing protein n=1 Tax=Erwinia papayae TaxID=206499 RepID=A0ABV3MXU9_9GAMM
MQVKTERAKKSRNRSVADSVIHQKNNTKQLFGLVDNRKEKKNAKPIQLLSHHYSPQLSQFFPKIREDGSVMKGNTIQCSTGFVIQRQETVESFLDKVIVYVNNLEMYSHQGYPVDGKRTKGDVENLRTKLEADYNSLGGEEINRLNEGDIDWSSMKNHYNHDTNLILFHAFNLHLQPLKSVSYIEGVSEYHQSHLVPKLDDKEISKRNYATLYYDITAQFNMAGRSLNINYSGSYAGRSGKYTISHTLQAPAQRGFGTHHVISTDKENQHYETFTDHHDRALDSEVAVFEDLSQMISEDLKERGIPHYTTHGNVNLFTDRATCNSCTALAMQFQNAWNVTVNVKHGGVDDFKGYVPKK